MFANQFNNLAHSGANHLVRGNVSVRFISIIRVSSRTVAGFMAAVSTDAAMHGISTATAGGVVGGWMDSIPEQQMQQHLKATKPHNQGPGHPGDVA